MSDMLEHSRRWEERPEEQRSPWRRVDFTTPGFTPPDDPPLAAESE